MKSFIEAPLLRASVGTLVLTLLIIFSGQAQTYDTTSYFYITSIRQSGKSLAFVKKDTSITTKPTVAGAPSQLWRWAPVEIQGISGYYRIVNKELGSELYLNATKVGDDFVLTFSPKKEATGQLWRAEDIEGNARIITMYLYKCIQVAPNGGLSLGEKTDSPAFIEDQLWKLTPQNQEKAVVAKTTQATAAVTVTAQAPKKAAGVGSNSIVLDTAAIYRIITTEMPEKSMGIETDGTIEQPVLEPAINHPLQEWKLSLNANGFYHLGNHYYKTKSLEVNSNGLIILNTTKDSKEQLWKIELTHEGAYQISSVWLGSGRSLDFVEDGEEKNGMRLSDVNSTIWTFIAKPTVQTVAPKTETKPVVISNNKNKLLAGEQLKENAKLISANGEYSLVQQPDGNLVIYNSEKKAMWASGMNGKNVKRCVMQKDGNLAQHPGGYDLVTWSTDTKGNAGAYAMLQDDGALVIINKAEQVIWSSKN